MPAPEIDEEPIKGQDIPEIDEIFRRLLSLGDFGAPAIARRFRSVFEPFVSKSLVELARCTGGPPGCFTPFSERLELIPCRQLNALLEIRSERRRVTGVFDSPESVASILIEMDEGSLDVIEMRGLSDETYSQGEQIAEEFRSAFCPMLRINDRSGIDPAQLASALRSAADDIEANLHTRRGVSVKTALSVSPMVKPVDCKYQSTEYNHTWESNGNVLKKWRRSVYRCRDDDACCSNAIITHYGDWELTEQWQQSDTYSKAPDILPPEFERQPWNNKCAVLQNYTGGFLMTSDYGWRRLNGKFDFHGGIDIGAPAGYPVISDVYGQVVHVDSTGGKGNTYVVVKLVNGDSLSTYMHIVPAVSKFQDVVPGTVLGTVSPHTVNAAGQPAIHLHFARHSPGSGKWEDRSDQNSSKPCDN